MSTPYQFDPVDVDRLRMLSQLTAGGRIRLMLSARELAVGLMRGRLRRRYPHLTTREINLKLLEELEDAANRQARSEFVPGYSEHA
jgi:phage terminase Nu1 subunit (DNA packaging protein)